MTPAHALELIQALQAAGLRPPDIYATPDGIKTACRILAGVLGDVEPHEAKRAVMAYVKGPSPWWPTPGQLLELVPRRQASLEAFDALGGPGPLSGLSRLLVARLGSKEEAMADRRRWCVLYRRLLEAWEALPEGERMVLQVGERKGRRAVGVGPSPRLLQAIEGSPLLLPMLTAKQADQRARIAHMLGES